MYQVVLFLPLFIEENSDCRRWVVDRFAKLFSEKEILSASIKPIFADLEWENYDAAFPTIAVYFRLETQLSDVTKTHITELIKDDVMFIPCYCEDFAGEVPEIIGEYQGIRFTSSFKNKLKNAILSYFHLIGNPKVFISYTQREKSTRDFALELFEELNKNRYTPFLDTCRIQPPSPFQTILEEELWDSDIIIMLDSRKYRNSQWCLRESALAAEAAMGIIRIEWPGFLNKDNYPLIENIKLNFWDLWFPWRRKRKIADIIRKVDKIRARAHASRHKHLYEKIASDLSIKRLTPQHKGMCHYYKASGYRMTKNIVPVIGIPHSQDFNHAHAALHKMGFELAYARLPHDSDTTEHIDWLADKLNIHIKPY